MKTFFDALRSLALGLAVAVLFPMLIYWGLAAVRSNVFTKTYQENQKLSAGYDIQTRAVWNLKGSIQDLKSEASPSALKQLEAAQKELDSIEQIIKTDLAPRHAAMIEKRDRETFFVHAIFGIAAIVVGAIIPLVSVGVGFIIGGVVLLTKGYWGYWGYLGDLAKFISLLLALSLVVFISYRLMYKKE